MVAIAIVPEEGLYKYLVGGAVITAEYIRRHEQLEGLLDNANLIEIESVDSDYRVLAAFMEV